MFLLLLMSIIIHYYLFRVGRVFMCFSESLELVLPSSRRTHEGTIRSTSGWTEFRPLHLHYFLMWTNNKKLVVRFPSTNPCFFSLIINPINSQDNYWLWIFSNPTCKQTFWSHFHTEHHETGFPYFFISHSFPWQQLNFNENFG